MTLKKTIGFLIFFLLWGLPQNTQAQQEGFLGEVKLFAGNYAPVGWAFCEGQELAINQNQALFAVLGIQYGGDGATYFNLPDLRGRVPVGAGTGNGLQTRYQGQFIGTETVTLTTQNLPSHTHTATTTATLNAAVSPEAALRVTPEAGDIPAAPNFDQGLVTQNVKAFGPPGNTAINTTVNGTLTTTLNETGQNQAFNVIQPALVMRYIICIQGVYPTRE